MCLRSAGSERCFLRPSGAEDREDTQLPALHVLRGSGRVAPAVLQRPCLTGARAPVRLHPAIVDPILNLMVQSSSRLDVSFAALSDATRRGVIEQLWREDASITELAERFQMTLTGMKKHVGVLEQAGLVTTEKVGRVRTCRLGRGALDQEQAWLERYRRMWTARFDALDKVVEELQRKERDDGRKK
jgi:DNA-binding transcriptional ArsR family regulator